MPKKSQEGLTVKKENFSEWYTQILNKAEITDIRYDVKGFIVIRPWGTMIIENMYSLYEKELQKKGHKPTFFPLVIPEKNFKKESSHIKGFSPEVFWLEKIKGEDKLALRPTSETAFYQMFSIWIRSWRDLPLKLYQRGTVYRYETKATRPLIRGREFYWIESHNAFSSKEEAEIQVKEDTQITEDIMHQKFLIPFLPMKRPSWDTFPGADYTVAADSIMPTGRLIQQPSTHLLKQSFPKAFNIKFKDKEGKEKYVWTTCYGPAQSRMLASVISIHGDDKGLVLPYSISPIKVIIIPIYTVKNKNKILKKSHEIKRDLEKLGISSDIDDSDKRPGEKFHEWELKGVPFRIEIGEKELNSKSVVLFTRDIGKKEKVSIKKLSKIENLGSDFDKRLLFKADKFLKGRIVNVSNKNQLKKAMNQVKIARVSWCDISEKGKKCAEIVEKEINVDVRGTLANKKEIPKGKCIICNKKANVVVYIGKSY